MASISSETIWSSMIAARQLSTTYYTLSTCLTDYLHRYFSQLNSSTSTVDATSSLFRNLDETLYSVNNQSKLLADYSNIIQNILTKNSLHTNIIQNVRRLLRFDTCLKQLFSIELNEHCQCQECDCTISNSITDIIHDVGEIRSDLLTASSQVPCVCFRCGDQSQSKTITFKQFNASLALSVNRLNIKATDQLTNAQGVIYDLVYIIEFDSTLRTISNVYLRQESEFLQVDGVGTPSRFSTISSQGKSLTLWLSRSSTPPQNQPFLSPPQSASSSSQLTTTSTVTTELSQPYQTQSTITFDEMLNVPVPAADHLEAPSVEDDEFWNTLTGDQSTPAVSEDTSVTTNNDTVSDLFLTLLHSTRRDSTPIKTRTDHDRLVNSISTDVIWPLIVDQTNRRTSKKTSSSTTSTVQSVSSNSSRSYTRLPSRSKSHRSHPYTTA